MSSMSFNCIRSQIHLKITDSCSAIKMGDFLVGNLMSERTPLE